MLIKKERTKMSKNLVKKIKVSFMSFLVLLFPKLVFADGGGNVGFQSLWQWGWQNLGQWAVIGLVVAFMIKEIKAQAWGKMIGILIIGAVVWAVGTGPTAVLSSIAEIINKVFGV